MTRRRDILIGLGLAAQLGVFWASPALARGLPIWAAAREPAGREAVREGDGPPARPQPAGREAPTPAPAAAPTGVQAGPPALSMEAVVAIVRRRTPGQLVGGPTRQGSNYFVRWKTTDGHVIDVVVDAVSGAIR